MITHVPIPLLVAEELGGERVLVAKGSERVEVEPLGDGGLRVASPPRFVDGLAAGDVVALDASVLQGFRVLRRSGNLTIRFYVPPGHETSLAALAAEPLGRLGAVFEGTARRVVIVTAHLSLGWEAIERTMNDIAARADNAVWEYGNVYDPLDGRPLGWWVGAESGRG